MNDERYKLLMEDETIPLTEEEIQDDWHFCMDHLIIRSRDETEDKIKTEWFGLLVGPDMPEYYNFCNCFRNNKYFAYSGWRRIVIVTEKMKKSP